VIEILQFIATLSAALFAGAALYINVAEHPARMSLQTQMAALQWAPSYQRATWLQAPLALASLVCGVSVWLLGGSPYWAMAAALVGAVVPVTFLVIMPTNHRLMTPGRDLTSPETRELLLRWGHLHAMRTILSVAGLVMYLCLLIA
jgi:membrane protein YdbS with pleckstrin-like domain